MNDAKTSTTAYAPGSIGNVGPGLDILGLAVAGAGDTVTVRRTGAAGVTILDPGHPELPADPERHTAALAAREVCRLAGANEAIGMELRVQKGLPLAGGQGGSAASAVAGAVAANAVLGQPLCSNEMIQACLTAETLVAGRHADNIAPSLLGGLVLIRSLEPVEVISIPVPPDLWIVLAHPNQTLRTEEGRARLPQQIPRDVALKQAAHVAALVAGSASNDLDLMGRALVDIIAEPARAPLLPGFVEAKAAALLAGALGCSISGSGPTAFAFAATEALALGVARAMGDAYGALGINSHTRVTQPDLAGARLIDRDPQPEVIVCR
ncbi:MAG: homoserine kinase [Gemmatimonadales bacterium]|nr:homoserine kinase [Gemmatimonadales bacterium]